jgi:transcriptional regulator with PAS, ATPase and Fis domain
LVTSFHRPEANGQQGLLLLPLPGDQQGGVTLLWFTHSRGIKYDLAIHFEPLLRFYAKLFQMVVAPAPKPDKQPSRPTVRHGIVGRSQGLTTVLNKIKRYAPTELNIYIWGESGTGKELVARALHEASDRREQAFRAINCSHFPDNLVETELFGHKRGAFTGASDDRVGILELVDGGTLFLDEIGDITPRIQSLMLRVLQEGEFSRIGETEVREVDIRFVTATNRDLHGMIDDGHFREDLFFRMVGETFQLPPLRERLEDLPLLTQHFVQKYEPGREVRFTRSFFKHLSDYHWPGNIRELEAYIRKLLIEWPDCDTFSERECPAFLRPDDEPRQELASLEDLEARNRIGILRDRLRRFGGNRTRAAVSLGISRQHLLNLIERYRLT